MSSQAEEVENRTDGQGVNNTFSAKLEGVTGGSVRTIDLYSTGLTWQATIDFPLFDETNVMEWIFWSERCFELDQTPPEMKVRIASVYMTGLTMKWHHAFIRDKRNNQPIFLEKYVATI